MKRSLADKLSALELPKTLAKARLRTKLRAILKDSHPDATGGKFQDQQQEIRYQTAVEALEILGTSTAVGTQLQVLAETQTALVQTQSSLQRIIDEQRQQVKLLEEQQSVEASESKATSAIAHSLHQIYTPLSVGGWSVAVVAAAIALLNKPLGGVIEEIFEGNVAASHWAKITLGIISLTGIILGFYARQREARELDRLKSIMTDAGIQYLLYRYGYEIFGGGDEAEEKTFTLSTLADGIARHTRIRDRSTCEATADAILKKLVQRGFANLNSVKSLSLSYTIDRTVTENIDYGVSWDFDQQPLSKVIRSRLKRFFSVRKDKL